MKLKITITGPKVQGVGYRQFVTELAMRLSLHGFEAFNEDDGSVDVLVAGDERELRSFWIASIKRPRRYLQVDRYTGRVHG